ncbi:hypothetical protein [Methylorubrum extorquens]|uniref:Uncharacterized protein n=1 Tax=Methylorubrum extorquens DSM 13060 TaxID=882800 RepID=H1KG85_METEX|nr:hypothetical protein [Methylorubrum extorquens]EHP93426.1 hypothetical protein MetexDRAFT_1647 [Methylorubrum extorquens DSM 13060]
MLMLHTAISKSDVTSAEMHARNSKSFAALIRKHADISDQADRALDQVVEGAHAIAAAYRSFGMMGRNGEAPIEAARNSALEAYDRLTRLVDGAQPSEMARVLGIG